MSILLLKPPWKVMKGLVDQTETERGCFRRYTRDRRTTKRLTYPELGNPLVTIVQSLFQSLSDVITDSLTDSNFPEPHSYDGINSRNNAQGRAFGKVGRM